MSPASPQATRARARRPVPTIRRRKPLRRRAGAWIGNYRVFTIPTPFGHEADTPEIIERVRVGGRRRHERDQLLGGGPETDPANDAMNETVHNTALAGVVPVIASGNDRDDYGLGSTGSPGTAPDAISVAAVSNAHVFAPALNVVGGPPSLGAVPIQIAGSADWATRSDDHRRRNRRRHRWQAGRPLSLRDGRRPGQRARQPAERVARRQDRPRLPRRCSFASKRPRAARRRRRIVLVDNRPGEANPIPMQLPFPRG